MLAVAPRRQRMRQTPTLDIQPERDPLATIAVSAAPVVLEGRYRLLMRALWQLRHSRRTRWAARSRVGCPHAPPRVPGSPSFRDHFVAALARPARLARSGRAAAPPCPGAQGVRVGTVVYEPRAALSACARRRQRRRGADRCRPSRPLRRCDADRGRAPLPRLSCRPAGNQPLACHARSDRQRRAGAARRRRRRLPGSRGRYACSARGRSRSRDRSRRGDRSSATPRRKRTRPALPARPLVEPAHDLARTARRRRGRSSSAAGSSAGWRASSFSARSDWATRSRSRFCFSAPAPRPQRCRSGQRAQPPRQAPEPPRSPPRVSEHRRRLLPLSP